MTTIFNDVQAALDTKLKTVTGTPVAFPNVPYKPQAGTAYLRASFLPAETVQASWAIAARMRLTAFTRLM